MQKKGNNDNNIENFNYEINAGNISICGQKEIIKYYSIMSEQDNVVFRKYRYLNYRCVFLSFEFVNQ